LDVKTLVRNNIVLMCTPIVQLSVENI